MVTFRHTPSFLSAEPGSSPGRLTSRNIYLLLSGVKDNCAVSEQVHCLLERDCLKFFWSGCRQNILMITNQWTILWTVHCDNKCYSSLFPLTDHTCLSSQPFRTHKPKDLSKYERQITVLQIFLFLLYKAPILHSYAAQKSPSLLTALLKSLLKASFQNENTRNPIKVPSIKPLKHSLKRLAQTCYSWVIGLSHFWNVSANITQLFVPVWLLNLRKYRLTFFWQNGALWKDGIATKCFRLVRKIGKIKVQSICLFLIIYVNYVCV